MYIEQIYTGCLAEAAYYIESEGEAVIIDPLRETEPYIARAAARGARIKYILETHFHADFVSGHLDLSRKTGAPIVFGPGAKTGYDIIEARDEQEFSVGKLILRVLHTPGHTPESSCFLLLDEQGKPHSIYTGDTLFIGDVGRPDLAQKDGEMTPQDMASQLYDSLRKKILPLPDDVIVYPAHGAGSACGKNMSKETFSTLGEQKKSNYALGDLSKDEFIRELTEGTLPPPQYFAKAAQQNKSGYKAIDEVYETSVNPLTPAQVMQHQQNNALLIDTRNQEDYRKGHIKGSWFIGLNGQFAPWAGALITDMHQPIVLVADEGKEQEAVMRLARVGYDNVLGYLRGGVQAWQAANHPLVEMASVTPEDFISHGVDGAEVLDVRKPSEFEGGHLENVKNIPLDFFMERLNEIDPSRIYAVHCKGGYRSMIAASILESRGVKGVVDIMGGFDKLKEKGARIVDYSLQF